MAYKLPDIHEKADYVQKNFNVIAGKYDLFNDLNSFGLHRLWKSVQVEQLKNLGKDGLTCLDLCCGTGDITLRLAKSPLVKKVYGADFSTDMLAVARHKLAGHENVTVTQGDATDLKDFKDSSLDAVTIGFGLRNVNDIDKAISEIFRVLKPNGLFLNLDVGKVKNPVIRYFADFYFFKIVPLMGHLIWGRKNEMFDYLPASSVKYPGQEELKSLLEKHRFGKVSYRNFVFGNVVLHISQK